MKIANRHSHLGGLEIIQVHNPGLWTEIASVIEAIDAKSCQTKLSKEKRTKGQLRYSPKTINNEFCSKLIRLGWGDPRPTRLTKDAKIVRADITKETTEQKAEMIAAGEVPIHSYSRTEFVKNRIAVEVQFGKHSFGAYGLFLKHIAFYVRDEIDVGVEILAMKSMQSHMSSGPAYYEGELYNVLRNGRGVPSVPLVIIGVIP